MSIKSERKKKTYEALKNTPAPPKPPQAMNVIPVSSEPKAVTL
jgi:hypothetical protein